MEPLQIGCWVGFGLIILWVFIDAVVLALGDQTAWMYGVCGSPHLEDGEEE